jgi:sensor histidine kinase regulating citrate/malate metabolism
MIAMAVIVLSSGALCFFGYRREAKSALKAKDETDKFAHAIVSTGSGYYQKMDEMHDKLRALRHDYKYHLNAVSGLLRGGNHDELENHLKDLESGLDDTELEKYCQNNVINALVASYEERCRALDIKFDVDIGILHTLSVPDYELCVIVGNLLENAVEASEKLSEGREIGLAARSTEAQFILMVRNRFDGNIRQDGETPESQKANGGVGLQSVKTVAARYGGELLTEWEENTFRAFVMVRV